MAGLTVTLDPKEIKEILIKHLKEEYPGMAVKDIDFEVDKQLEGYGMQEHYVTRFNGATCSMRKGTNL
ncbi:hypothetical protein [Bacillus phage CP-51]|uniref:Uncharacterized protein n=1 Tax=Bacillus phage CP-51 TaxID=1391188 RepID=A0A068EN02_9CAUD|nr:hypothetical protein OZ73_gp210 [Bacillus phage CP-51]AID50645.1 hypothetical protein [Bacillus phage CP-51]